MLTNETTIAHFKEEYLRSRVVAETTVSAVIKRLMQYEHQYSKSFADFADYEILRMYSEAKSRSAVSLQNWLLIAKHFARWVGKNDSAYETITKEQLQECIDIETKNRMLWSREELTDIQGQCLNAVDVAILELCFLGITGDGLTDLTYLERKQVSRTDLMIYFKDGRRIPIDERVYNILDAAFNETELVSYSKTQIVSKVNGQGQIFKERANTFMPPTDERRFRWALRRITLVREYFGVNLTFKSLSASGLWFYMQKDMKEHWYKDFREYVKTESAKNLAQRYGFNSQLYVQVLIDKFGDLI